MATTVLVHNKAGDKVGEVTGETFARFRSEQAKLREAQVAVAVHSEGETHLLTSSKELATLPPGIHKGELLEKVALPSKRAGAEAWRVL